MPNDLTNILYSFYNFFFFLLYGTNSYSPVFDEPSMGPHQSSEIRKKNRTFRTAGNNKRGFGKFERTRQSFP